ncbi:hypothetical protein CROQUDRAFT_130199 [Cronartium quercuum f. sp. fusiforme G11]|uniref:Uncharacterized protein n=1 Tax=Cronartium quercuum f. sp. fusiforme G11 TaxID=708437 RepID=A0A9P6TGA3_9BASI|nr:hypothetical protein CROQUDRAFT_130199 [Cronartium quercuum f. sp. fusiforme G11]
MRAFRYPTPPSKLERQLEAWQSSTIPTRDNSYGLSSSSSSSSSSASSSSSSAYIQSLSRAPSTVTVKSPKNPIFLQSEINVPSFRSETYQIIETTRLNQYKAKVLVVGSIPFEDESKYAVLTRSSRTKKEELGFLTASSALLSSPERKTTTINENEDQIIGLEGTPCLPSTAWPSLTSTISITKSKSTKEKSTRKKMESCLKGINRVKSLGRKSCQALDQIEKVSEIENSTLSDSTFPIPTQRKRKDAIFDLCHKTSNVEI